MSSTTPSSPESPEPGQKRRGRPRLDDKAVGDLSTSEAERNKIIYKRKYARKYRDRIRSDLKSKEQLRQMLNSVKEDNQRLRDSLDTLRQQNHQIIQNLLMMASTSRLPATPAVSDVLSSSLNLQGANPQPSFYPTFSSGGSS
uniref:BZIP domain-containing protein n=1 Tax=Steinernema glaseri TaxID=37863 RepID=A0A1I7ZWY6_9BILA